MFKEKKKQNKNFVFKHFHLYKVSNKTVGSTTADYRYVFREEYCNYYYY